VALLTFASVVTKGSILVIENLLKIKKIHWSVT